MNIIGYLEWEHRPMQRVPFSEVDSLVLSTFAYFNFEDFPGLFPEGDTMRSLSEIVSLCDPEHFTPLIVGSDRAVGQAFARALAASRRFADVRGGIFSCDQSFRQGKQFAAVTYLLPDGAVYVAFRGTDDSLAGWREDFALSYSDELPSHADALAYLELVAEHFPDKRLRVGGHSKGGNLAEYAVAKAPAEVFGRVQRIYNHEGPGFATPPARRMDSDVYLSRLRKTVVEQSLVGVLFEWRDICHVVRASGQGIAQHSPFRWKVSGGSFVYTESLTQQARRMGRALSAWLATKSTDERVKIVDALFALLAVDDVRTLSEASEMLHKDPGRVLEHLFEDNARQTRFVLDAFSTLPQSAFLDTMRRRQARMSREQAATMPDAKAEADRSPADTAMNGGGLDAGEGKV